MMMSALGNALALVTIVPTMVQQVALDLSLVPVYVAGFFGGPIVGGVTGLLSGVVPSVIFGPFGSLGPLGLSVAVGKCLVGLTTGLLSTALKARERRSIVAVPIVFAAFLPEAGWIYLVFSTLVPALLHGAPAFLQGLWAPILVKATFEVTLMAFFTAALAGHLGFRNFAAVYLGPVRPSTAAVEERT